MLVPSDDTAGLRAVIYTRVSTGVGMQADGFSLDAQLNGCRKLAAERQWQVVAVYTDVGISGKTTARPKFREMMRDAQAGRFDVLVVHKLDRLSRSVVDTLTTLNSLNKVEVTFFSVMENVDFTGPMGKIVLTMLAAFAQWYLDNLSIETAKGKKARAEAGLWNSAVPFGYTVDYKKDGGDGLAYPDEDDRDGALYMFEQYGTGLCSDNDVARLLSTAGYRPKGRGDRALAVFSKDTVTDMLQNRFYVGEVQYKGKWYEGVHEPIIPQDLFDRCQEIRRKRRRRSGTTARNGSRVYPLTGVAQCARCKRWIRGSFASGRRYYRDPARQQGGDCDQQMVRAGDAEAALGAFLGRLVLPANWQERVLEILQEQLGAKQDVAQEQARIEKQLERLKRLYVLGDLTELEYLAERDRLQAQLVTLTPPAMPDLERAAELLRDFGAIWEAETLQERRKTVHYLLSKVYLDSGDQGPVVAIEPKAEFASLFGMIEPGEDGGITILEPGAELEEW